MRIETYGYTMPVHPMMDWCRMQRLINALGGGDEFAAFDSEPLFTGDRLTQYGFDLGRPAPDQPGVYAVVASVIGLNLETGFYRIGAEHLLYIGCGKSIAKRLADPSHHYWRSEKRLRGVSTRHMVTEDYVYAERSLIRTLRPLLNIHHNG